MQLNYDPRHNVAYLKFQAKTAQVETVRVSESLLVDLTPDGTIYGIEFLNANEQLLGKDAGRLILTNEDTGKATQVTIPWLLL